MGARLYICNENKKDCDRYGCKVLDYCHHTSKREAAKYNMPDVKRIWVRINGTIDDCFEVVRPCTADPKIKDNDCKFCFQQSPGAKRYCIRKKCMNDKYHR